MIKKLIKHALPVSIFFFVILFCLLFPFYKYIFDPDSIGYSAVAERVAGGDYFNSINGYWSPLSSWLNVPFIKMGINTVTGFKYLNGLIGLMLLFSTSKLINQFIIKDWLKALILYTCVPIFLSYCFYELCADFLLLLFFVLYLIQISSADFFENKKRIFFCALAATLAYLAKAYFFPFFFAHFILINIYHYKTTETNFRIKRLFQNILVGIGSFLALSSFWIYALSSKYHFFTFSNTGKYNSYVDLHTTSLYPKLLLSPPYQNSLNSWEDPWQPFMQHFSAFTSSATMIKQAKIFFLNLVNIFPSFTAISFLSLAIIGCVIFLSLTKNASLKIPENIMLLAITAILMPSGYLLFHLETRFIWIESILGLIIGTYLISALFDHFILTSFQKIFLVTIFIGSFLSGPIQSLKEGINSGKGAYLIADALKNNNIQGKIVANYITSEQYTDVLMSNVIAKNQFYNYSRIDFTTAEMANAIKEFDIDYYIFSYTTEFEKESFANGYIYKNAIRVISDIYPGIMVLKLK